MKPLPKTVRGIELELIGAVLGEMELIAGAGFNPVPTTTNGKLLDTAPETFGSSTMIEKVPALESREAGTTAERSLVSKNVVANGLPLKLATTPGTKLVPLKPSVRSALPASTWFGVKEAKAGVTTPSEKGPGAWARIL